MGRTFKIGMFNLSGIYLENMKHDIFTVILETVILNFQMKIKAKIQIHKDPSTQIQRDQI